VLASPWHTVTFQFVRINSLFQHNVLLGRQNFGVMANINEHAVAGCESFPEFTSAPVQATSSVGAPGRARSRSSTIKAESNPLEIPLTPTEVKLARLVGTINRVNEREEEQRKLEEELRKLAATRGLSSHPSVSSNLNLLASRSALAPQFRPDLNYHPNLEFYPNLAPLPDAVNNSRVSRHRRHPSVVFSSIQSQKPKELSDYEDSESDGDYSDLDLTNSKLQKQKQKILDLEAEREADEMNYQYLDNSAAGPSNPRQAPPSPSQNMNHANGMNGGAMGIGGMVGFPTPAGHQSDLNYIMSMVDELSRQLEHNQRMTDNVVDKIGKVREKASKMDLSNDEIIALVTSELSRTSLIQNTSLLVSANILSQLIPRIWKRRLPSCARSWTSVSTTRRRIGSWSCMVAIFSPIFWRRCTSSRSSMSLTPSLGTSKKSPI
jgi:hypothetical protein